MTACPHCGHQPGKRKPTRSLAQNAFLWGVVYPAILEKGGEQLRGWESQDLHEFFLGEHFGWETLTGLGRRRMRPIRRSSRLSVSEFMGFLDFIDRKMAQIGILIPSPGQEAA